MNTENKSSLHKHKIWAYVVSFTVFMIGLFAIDQTDQSTHRERAKVCISLENVEDKIVCLKEARE